MFILNEINNKQKMRESNLLLAHGKNKVNKRLVFFNVMLIGFQIYKG